VTDRTSLLNQLRIDRSSDDRVAGARPWRWIAGACAAAALGASVWLFAPSREPAVAATATLPPAAPIAAESPSTAAPDSILDASGYVVARRQATVSSKITGKVVAVLIEEGQRVAAGDVIARLDDTNARAERDRAAAELEQQLAELRAHEVALANATPRFERHRQQFAAAFISAQAFDDAKASYDAALTSLVIAQRGVEVAEANLELRERNLDDTIVRAPFGGVVTVKAAQEGEMVSPISAGGGFTRTGLGTVVDMDSLEVEVDVSENFISRVRPGQSAAITLNAYPDRRLPGRVIAIVPTADRAKATVKVRVGFEQRDVGVLPEMGARVAFLGGDKTEEKP
jgi:RND family efflux transporter MFP subunit